MKKSTVRRALAALLTMTLCLALLAGCGAKHVTTDLYTDGGMANKADAPAVLTGFSPAQAEQAESEKPGAPSQSSGNLTMPDTSGDTKFIFTGTVDAETKDLTAAVNGITALVYQYQGYFEDTQVRQAGSGRYATLVARIPQGSFETFLNAVDTYEAVSVISKNSSATNISETYYDLENRIATLRAKQTRLRELLSQAESMEDLLTIESALTDVEYQIENYTTQKNHYDSEIDFSTVTISLREVTVLGTGTEPVSFGQRIAKAFTDGLARFRENLADFIVWFFENLISIVVFLVLLLIVIAIIRGCSRRARRRREKKAAEAARAMAQAYAQNSQPQDISSAAASDTESN